jgi:hypothetical protein
LENTALDRFSASAAEAMRAARVEEGVSFSMAAPFGIV